MRTRFVGSDLAGKIKTNSGVIMYLTTHSKQRIEDRGITDDEIIETFLDGDTSEPNKSYSNVQDFSKRIGKRTLRIGVRIEPETLILVTAFYH